MLKKSKYELRIFLYKEVCQKLVNTRRHFQGLATENLSSACLFNFNFTLFSTRVFSYNINIKKNRKGCLVLFYRETSIKSEEQLGTQRENMFAMTRFCCIKVSFHILTDHYWGQEDRSLYQGLYSYYIEFC